MVHRNTLTNSWWDIVLFEPGLFYITQHPIIYLISPSHAQSIIIPDQHPVQCEWRYAHDQCTGHRAHLRSGQDRHSPGVHCPIPSWGETRRESDTQAHITPTEQPCLVSQYNSCCIIFKLPGVTKWLPWNMCTCTYTFWIEAYLYSVMYLVLVCVVFCVL